MKLKLLYQFTFLSEEVGKGWIPGKCGHTSSHHHRENLSLSLMFIPYVYIQSSNQTLPIKGCSGGFLKIFSSRIKPCLATVSTVITQQILDFVPFGSVHFTCNQVLFMLSLYLVFADEGLLRVY